MARPFRVQFSGALYHIAARRNERDRPAQVWNYLSLYLCVDAQARSAWR